MDETARKIGASIDHERRPEGRFQPRTATQAVVKQKPVSAKDSQITSAAR
jgi:hypothetical protein